MSNAAAAVFISYRRQEANWLAAWLHDRLVAHFGEARVFLDIDWIKPGVDFMQVITEAIARSRVLLVIIGQQWLAAEGDGGRRLDRPDDPVRVELETALRQGLRVIPLLLEGATMPRTGDLPGALAGLARLNALQVGYQSARSDVARLVETLADELGIAPTPGLPTAESAVGLGPEPRRTRSAERAAAVDAERDEEQRGRLLGRLSRTYTEYRNQSVEHDAILELQLELDWLPGRTFRPQDRLLPVLQRQAERLPAGTTLLQAFDRAGGLDGDGLLVLGEPGAGKTTLLFELARCLAERAQTDHRHPLPVYLPLSSWATRRPPLDEWLVEQLNELYQVPRPLGRRWTAGTQLLFVLDGLDEIPDRSDRLACVKAINQFTRFGRSSRLPMVVASRPIEYDTLPVQLQLETAIGVRPLDPTVVLDDLEHAPGMQAVVAAVRGDPELLELLRSPLLVSMLTLAYAGVPEAQIHAITGSPAERRHQLITDYVHRRFELDRRSGEGHQSRNTYPPERARAWLSALALNLTQQQQTVFLPGRTQPEWLPNPWGRWAVIAAPGLSVGLIGLIYGLSGGLFVGLLVGLPTLLGAGLGAGLVGHSQPAERLSWSWRRARSKLGTALFVALIAGLSVGLIAALIAGLNDGLLVGLITGAFAGLGAGLVGHPQPAERLSWSWRRARSKLGTALFVALITALIAGLIAGLIFGLSAGLIVGLIVGLSGGLSKGLIPIYFTPYEGIRRSVRNGLIVALIVGLSGGLIAGLIFALIVGRSSGLSSGPIAWLSAGLSAGLSGGLSVGLSEGLSVALIAGLAFGLDAAVQHGIFRLLLWAHHVAPLRTVRWLNYMVRLRLLYRGTSGGYLFIHRIMQDYFCEAVVDRPSQESA